MQEVIDSLVHSTQSLASPSTHCDSSHVFLHFCVFVNSLTLLCSRVNYTVAGNNKTNAKKKKINNEQRKKNMNERSNWQWDPINALECIHSLAFKITNFGWRMRCVCRVEYNMLHNIAAFSSTHSNLRPPTAPEYKKHANNFDSIFSSFCFLLFLLKLIRGTMCASTH